jgi:putative phosphoribosyl transferase
MAAKVIPTHPDLEQYRKQAKDLLKRSALGTPDATERIRQHHPRLRHSSHDDIRRAVFKLADAQLVIAREHGFESWPKFSAHIRSLSSAARSGSFTELITLQGIQLAADIVICDAAKGIVQFIVAGSVSRHHPVIRQIARQLNRASYCTVLADVLTQDEEVEDAIDEQLRFDIRMLAQRAAAITAWIVGHSTLANRPVGYLAFGTGSAAAVIAAAETSQRLRAIVSCAGRPDLAGPWLGRIQAPALFIVGGEDTVALGFTKSVMPAIARHVPSQLAVLPGAGQIVSEGAMSEQAGTLACQWFERHLMPR